jgi:hypothetical protein
MNCPGDELEETIREFEARHPGIRADMDRVRVIMRMTTALYAEAVGLQFELQQIPA